MPSHSPSIERVCAAAAAAGRRRAEAGGDASEVCIAAIGAAQEAADAEGLGPAARPVAREVASLQGQRLPGAPTPFIEALEALMATMPLVWADSES